MKKCKSAQECRETVAKLLKSDRDTVERTLLVSVKDVYSYRKPNDENHRP